MGFQGILALAVGVAMDATAVAGTLGVTAQRVRVRDAVLVALTFGGFQAGMPMLGWSLGARLGTVLAAFDHWIAFVLLVGIGAKMLWDARTGAAARQTERAQDVFVLRTLVPLAVATSIDALAVGVTLPMLGAPLGPSVAAMGVTTAILSAVGLYAGRRFGALLGKRLEVVGGLVLIGLGARFLLQHLRP